jgi:D-alanyl-D-alanine carboxypeptidase
MTSVLQGGRRKRRAGTRIARLLVALAPLAVVVAAIVGLRGGDHRISEPAAQPVVAAGMQGAPAAAGEIPGATPTPEGIAPDPTQAALSGVDAFHLRFKRMPRAGMVFDVETGEILWRHRPLERVPIASLTKIMTALVVLEHSEPKDEVRITKDALNYEGSGVGLLPKGRHVPLEALLHGLLLPSGNDAANALADHVAGSREAFVAMMNDKARELGLRCTHFATPSGLERGDRSCPADLAALTRLAMRQYRIKRIVRKTSAALRFPIKGGRLFLYTTNPLLRMRYRGTIGLKTGYSRAAGRCLVAVVQRGGRTLAAVVLNSPDPQIQVRRLFAKAFYL